MKSDEIIYEEVDKKVIVNFKTEYIRQEGILALYDCSVVWLILLPLIECRWSGAYQAHIPS